ncbi:hypothetical protein F3Y22_tig00110674pilonHSYRG00033 [Hibiscus syriacus]|uniref:Reverse transcriptase zinc-binding domain-containing protein n=1 Tax=Hibiscus syriacus TaxID=106335 RepID=A0A6A2ZXB3_HIBSY|nr:hypothetical protein F3Y22_tig00110674pilonHSYRG00033 [Hibiscus syriacus]
MGMVIQLGRNLFDWEVEQWHNFIATLNHGAMNRASHDFIKWEGNSLGTYSPNGYCEQTVCEGTTADPMWKAIWAGLAPSNVEAFMWKAVQGRIPIRYELQKREVIIQDLGRCALCDKFEDTVDLLLCHLQGSVGAAGIGGLLRDHNGETLIRFARHIGQSDSTSAEMVAILEALPAPFKDLAGECFKICRRQNWKVKAGMAPLQIRNCVGTYIQPIHPGRASEINKCWSDPYGL